MAVMPKYYKIHEEEVCEFIARWGYRIQEMTEEVYAEFYYPKDGEGNG